MRPAADLGVKAAKGRTVDQMSLDVEGVVGGVDKMPDPQPDGCDEDETEEAVGGLVVTCGQSSAVFEL
jgi:hypothetical protein